MFKKYGCFDVAPQI